MRRALRYGLSVVGARARTASFEISHRHVHDGINPLTISTRRIGALMPRADLRLLHVESSGR